MNILLLGSGGREHALALKLAESHLLTDLFIAPGNAGTSKAGTNLPLSLTDFNGIKNAVLTHHIDMVVVGPEDPLVNGLHDFFLAARAWARFSTFAGGFKDGGAVAFEVGLYPPQRRHPRLQPRELLLDLRHNPPLFGEGGERERNIGNRSR